MKKSIWDTRFSHPKLTFSEVLKRSGLAFDGWVTMNGSRVLIGEAGEILGGLGGEHNGENVKDLKAHREALRGIRDKAYESANKVINSDPANRDLPENTKNELIAKAAAKEAVPQFSTYLQQHETSNPPESLSAPMAEKDAIHRTAGSDKTGGSCASVTAAFLANQELGLNVLDFHGGVSQAAIELSGSMALAEISESGYDAEKEGGGIFFTQPRSKQEACAEAFKALESMKPGEKYVAALGIHMAVVRKLASGEIQYLELQGDDSSNIPWRRNGWQRITHGTEYFKRVWDPNGAYSGQFKSAEEMREAEAAAHIDSRFKMGAHLRPFAHGVVPAKRYINMSYVKESLQYINTAESKQQKGEGGSIK